MLACTQCVAELFHGMLSRAPEVTLRGNIRIAARIDLCHLSPTYRHKYSRHQRPRYHRYRTWQLSLYLNGSLMQIGAGLTTTTGVDSVISLNDCRLLWTSPFIAGRFPFPEAVETAEKFLCDCRLLQVLEVRRFEEQVLECNLIVDLMLRKSLYC